MIGAGAFLSFNIAVVLLILGKVLTLNIAALRRWSIPEPVVGGVLCAAVVGLAWGLAGLRISFDLGARDFLLLVFFASIGLKSDLGTLMRGGRPLVILVGLATVFIVIQNLAGMGMAGAFGLDPRAGLMVGSVALTGGAGTTVAWAPVFVREFGIENALEIGMAANTLGLIAACLIGGPLAALLIGRGRITTPGRGQLDVGVTHEAQAPVLDYYCLLWAILLVNVTVVAGTALAGLIELTGVNMPTFVSCLFAGIALRNLMPVAVGRRVLRLWPGIGRGLSLLSDLALGLFLTMALMGLQFWLLGGVFVFVALTLALQVLLTLAWVVLVVFPAMGRDYEATVISAAFGGISLGSTATAIANMTAVTQEHGPAHRAFIIVPLVSGFFIDIINALIISGFTA